MMTTKCIASIFLAACLAHNTFGHLPTVFERAEMSTAVAVAEKYVRTELYFGLSRKGGPDVTESEFQVFIDQIVTPRFAGGLTIMNALGQWRESDSTITRERSKVLVLLYPKRDRQLAGRKIEEIRDEFKKRFAQSSVLRVDMSKSLKVSF